MSRIPHPSANGNGLGFDHSHHPQPHPHPQPQPQPQRQAERAQRTLCLRPAENHEPDSYEDLQQQLEFSPLLFASLERYLPDDVRGSSRDSKFQFMREILSRYCPDGERTRVHKHKEYRHKIIENYKLLHKELNGLKPPGNIFVPSFLKAIKENTEQSFKDIMTEPVAGVYTFDMLQPSFCKMLMSEVNNFERWVHDTRLRIMRPNTMNKYGAVLGDFGLETMLDNLMKDYVRPLSRVLFPEVGETLDSHHGFVVEYGLDRDVDLGFHVDDSEVTLNVCLGEQFLGGELFFRGVRCDKHVNTESQAEERFDYAHVPGWAVLHRGRHRHGARATTSGHRMNLILWCRSSLFREMKKYQKDCSRWCGECRHEKKERHRLSIDAAKLELLRRDSISAS